MGVGQEKLNKYLVDNQITIEELKKGSHFLKLNQKNPVLMTSIKKDNWICP